mmetsp:Transcript_116064/g.369287  ORF Transcript_116064/g.369287 Transcript_116064/m.369287 type:complete len:112 (+) Transcript_116064:617-952(+)
MGAPGTSLSPEFSRFGASRSSGQARLLLEQAGATRAAEDEAEAEAAEAAEAEARGRSAAGFVGGAGSDASSATAEAVQSIPFSSPMEKGDAESIPLSNRQNFSSKRVLVRK